MKRLCLLAVLPSLAMAAPVIPAGSLDQVLRAYTLASGALLSADGRLTLDLRSPGLDALSAPDQDLPRILSGTGLEAVRTADGSYLLRQASSHPELEAAPAQLPEVVARADAQSPYDTVSRFAVKGGAQVRDTPQALSIIEAAQIQEHAASGIGDLLWYVPGVQASLGEGNRDSVVFRGYNSSADFYVDGLRDDAQYYRDLYNSEAVEVLKGPNAMALGRGGSGGAINRIVKQAQWRDIGEADLLLGAWNQRRTSVDIGAAINPQLAWRLNAVGERSDSFRDGVWMRRYGINPALAWRDGDGTRVQLNYEHFHDLRTTDRGVPSYNGRPLAGDAALFYGDPANSSNGIDVDSLTLRLERQVTPSLKFTGQLHYAAYDKYYQNVFTGGVIDGGASALLLAYRRNTRRSNLQYQGELETVISTGALQHRLSAGVELDRQRTDNARITGFFDGDQRFVYVPVTQPTVHQAVTFRATDTDMANASKAQSAALYWQDQITLSPQWQLLAGLRSELVRVDFRDIRNAQQLGSHDHPLSPRLGLVYRPLPPLSLYASYSKTYVLRAGEQMASLTADNQALEPEVVRNRELGLRWEGGDALSLSAAFYQSRRGNVLVDDPVNAGESDLVEGQRGHGVELELTACLSPDWKLSAGYAWQRSRLTATQYASSQAGAQMPHVPHQTFSLWSTHTLTPVLEASLGVIARASMYSSTSNATVLPGYARVDASVAWRLDRRNRLQLSVENLFDRSYFSAAYNDNNIMPGAPRSLKIALHSQF
ncbi:TonB-dependent siderophore receptor [Duganella sp. FT80W]|uniref:TonB-dependent siderophore receptor n=1 Tax=Duganella guangzhouensis TaxID=2666084 RepID=A0A6I2L1H8_9BURK|nr:TonB-dependent siderophore receptor [Duganella guangzhouensis]MRW92031.1 TonB-dependent siderophore receptor [Duganella guangzhouensis]